MTPCLFGVLAAQDFRVLWGGAEADGAPEVTGEFAGTFARRSLAGALYLNAEMIRNSKSWRIRSRGRQDVHRFLTSARVSDYK